jgi:hypothetical protein
MRRVALGLVTILVASTATALGDLQFNEDEKRCNAIENATESKACYDKAIDAWADRIRVQQEEREREAEREINEAAAKKERERKQAAAAAAAARKRDAETAPQRQAFATEYQALLSRLYPQLNYIKVDVDRSGPDFALLAKHTYLTEYSFDIGPQGPIVADWVGKRGGALREARINRVGIKAGGGAATYYSVP